MQNLSPNHYALLIRYFTCTGTSRAARITARISQHAPNQASLSQHLYGVSRVVIPRPWYFCISFDGSPGPGISIYTRGS